MKNEYLKKISSLINDLNGTQFEDEFDFLIRVIKNGTDEYEANLIMDVMCELAEMQWETYEILPELIRRNLGDVIIKIWNRNSLDSTEKLVAIIAKLGLGNALIYLSTVENDIINPAVKNEIASAIVEFGNHVDDPYSGMK